MLQQYYKINSAAGVQIEFCNNRKLLINCCNILVKGSDLTIQEKISSITDIGELKRYFPGGHLVALNLSGRGILQKQTEKLEIIDAKEFNKLFPNALIEDFYLQNFISGERSFITIIRRSEADEQIRALKEYGFNVLMLSLGPFPVDNILSQLNLYEDHFIFNGYDIATNEKQQWTGLTYSETNSAVYPLKVESEAINEELIIPYAVAFQLVLADKVNLILADAPELHNNFLELISDKKLKVLGSIFGLLFFIILLLNFIFLTNLNAANIELSRKASQTAQSSFNLKTMEEQIQDKEALLRKLGWNQGVNKSRLIDQLADLLPEDINLTEIVVDPIDAELSRVNKTLSFSNNQILIKGNAIKVTEINEWMARLKTKSWVKNIQMVSYVFNNETNMGEFTLTIDY